MSLARAAAARLLGALLTLEQGDRARAADEAHAAIEMAPADALVRLCAGVVLSAGGQHEEGLLALRRAEEMDERLAPMALELAFQRVAPLGWDAEVIEIAARAIRLGQRPAEWHARALRLHVQRGDVEGALPHATALRKRMPESAAVAMELAGLFAMAGREADAGSAALASLAREPSSVNHHLEAARILVDAGDIEEARRCFSRALELDAQCVPARLGLATLALWSGDVEGCAAQVEKARAIEPDSTARIEGATALLAGRHEDALRRLDVALAANARDDEARLLRAESLLRLGRQAEARAEVNRALLGGGHALAARILWLLLDAREQGSSKDTTRQALAEVKEGLIELCPEARASLSPGERAALERVVEEALHRLHGNRSATPTHVVDGRLRRLSVRTGPRHASRMALELVRIAPPARVLAALDVVVARYPGSGLPLAHRGELHLWAGATGEARRDFEGAIAIEKQTRFAYIGLTGVEILEGRYEEALAVSARGVAAMLGTEGPAVPVYRGEALRRLGRTAEAIADLERSVRATPARLGAWINLGLACGDAGDLPGLAAAFTRLGTHAPALVSAAARELGALEGEASPEAQRAILDRCLVMMRGNRSSVCTTYFTREGHLRCVPQHARTDTPHPGDTRDLGRVRRLLAARLA